MNAPGGIPTERLAERMRAKYTIDADSGCWVWHASKDGHGYGQLRIDRRNRTATHVALELAGRPRTAERPCALHRCDNPACVNPDHLWWGTLKENTRDMMAKGRMDQSGLLVGHELSRARKQPKPLVNCKKCGVEFFTSKAQFQKNIRHFCSRTCCWMWQRENFTGASRAEFGAVA